MSAPLSHLAGWAAEALIASTLLMALVLAMRGPARRAFGPQIGYALWLLPLLRLVMPPLPATWREATPIARAGETIGVLIIEPMASAVQPGAATGTDWPALFALLGSVVAVVWLAGAVGFLLYHVVTHRRFCGRIVAAACTVEDHGGVHVVTSAAAPGPLAFGLWHRYVAFPIDFAERYDADERALALAHELGHHQRGDLIANWAALAVLALHWFNPLAWRAFHAFRADQELANDARVLAGRSVDERHVYACAIVKAAHGGAVSAACHLHTITDLKGRLKMLSLSPVSRRRLASGATAIGALVVAGLGLTASGSSAAAISAGVKEAVAQTVPPAPPEPPMPPVPPVPTPGNTQTSTTTTTANGHTVKKVIVVRNGKSTMYDDADIDAHLAAGEHVSIAPLAPDSSRMIFKMDGDPTTNIEVQDIPAIRSASCGIGTGTPTSLVVRSQKGPKRMIVICTDRIRQVTADAMVTLGNSKDMERNAYRTALTGLVDARTRIAANADMTEVDRTRALTAIDTSITEMKGQIARFN